MALPMHRTGRIPEDTFGTRLAIIRQAMGWATAAEAALKCGDLGDQNWRNWEAGKRPRDYQRVSVKVAEATGFDLDWIMSGGPLAAQNWKKLSRPDLRVIDGTAEVTSPKLARLTLV